MAMGMPRGANRITDTATAAASPLIQERRSLARSPGTNKHQSATATVAKAEYTP